MSCKCPLPPHIDLTKIGQQLRQEMENSPPPAIDTDAIVQALAYPATEYFITTNVYWDCQCAENYIKPASMPMCEDCDQLREDSPPSRINEVRAHGIHLDWTSDELLATLEEHSAADRRRDVQTIA